MILTNENIHAAASERGGFNSAQLTILGANNSDRGWLQKLIGKEISDEDYQKLLLLKGAKKQMQIAIVPNRRKFFVQKPKKGTDFELKQQFHHVLASIKAGELISAQDAARKILEIVESL
jgi:hypothetical protein